MGRAWLRNIRKLAGLTHRQVAKLCHIERAYYTQIERNSRTPSVQVAQRIAQVLQFNWINFFNGEQQ